MPRVRVNLLAPLSVVISFSRCAGADERYPRDHLCCGTGFSRYHLVFRRRNADDAREYEAGLPRPDCADRYLVGDWSAAWLCSATGITRRTDSAKLTEQSKHHPLKKTTIYRHPTIISVVVVCEVNESYFRSLK